MSIMIILAKFDNQPNCFNHLKVMAPSFIKKWQIHLVRYLNHTVFVPIFAKLVNGYGHISVKFDNHLICPTHFTVMALNVDPKMPNWYLLSDGSIL